MSKSYTLKEICENRAKIKSIHKDISFNQISKICTNCGELMFFDVLMCQRPIVYASFVNRNDAIEAVRKINDKTTMSASLDLPKETNAQQYTNTENKFVLDISDEKLNEWQQARAKYSVNCVFFSLFFSFKFFFFEFLG